MVPTLQKLTERAMVENPDLILIDLDLLDEPAIQTIRNLREQQACPVIVLISPWNAESSQRIYDTGVDDCVIKPVEAKLLVVKVKAWLRRRIIIPMEMLNLLRVGKVLLDPHQKVLIIDESVFVRLTNIEVRLLYLLMSQAGRIYHVDEMCTLVWKSNEEVCQAILKNTMIRLRNKLESGPANLKCIQFVTGYGYKFDLSMKSEPGTTVPARALQNV
jgi:two-component system KDP operon response regulator KdpE